MTLFSLHPSLSTPNQFRGLDRAPLPLVHINREIQYISSFEVEVAFRNSRLDSLPRKDYGDREEAVITIPATSFPHPHILFPTIVEDEDETSDTETIRTLDCKWTQEIDRGSAMQSTTMSHMNSTRSLKVTVED